MNLSLQDAAIHEIGHTIIALVLGYPVRDVKIIATHKAWGEMRIKAYSWRHLTGMCDRQQLMTEKAMIDVAGYLAQCLAAKRQLNLDYHIAEWFTAQCRVGGDRNRFNQVVRRTWDILRRPENQRAARMLVKALLHERRLTGKAVHQIFNRTRVRQENHIDGVRQHHQFIDINPRRMAGQSIGLYLRRLWASVRFRDRATEMTSPY